MDGDVGGAVLDAAKRHNATLVVGLRRRSVVGKPLMGCVAQRIILDADCQVLGVENW